MDLDGLRRIAAATQFDLATLEKDYALTWLLYGIYTDGSPARDYLIFKGGTAIRKVHLPEWRLSEDLDFTVLDEIAPEAIRAHLETTLSLVEDASGLAFSLSQYHGRPYYTQGRVQFTGPLGHKNTVKLDISFTETLIHDPVTIDVTPEYGVPPFNALVYPLDEILIEKLRSIMQRGYARDYYDTWRLLERDGDVLGDALELLPRKCELTEVPYRPELIFDDRRLVEAKRHWETALSRLTPDLPAFEQVIDDLRRHLQPSDT